MAVPENVEELSVAEPNATNFPVESSNPKKPTFAPELLYLNLIPLSRLSSELSSPISKTGSAIETVVELTVVVVPLTVKFPAIVTLSGRPIVTVLPEPLVSISLNVPTIERVSLSKSIDKAPPESGSPSLEQ